MKNMLIYEGEFCGSANALVELKNGVRETRKVYLNIEGKYIEWSEDRTEFCSEPMSEYEFIETTLKLDKDDNDEDIKEIVKLKCDIYDIDWLRLGEMEDARENYLEYMANCER